MKNTFKFYCICPYNGIISHKNPPLYNEIWFKTDVHNSNIRNRVLLPAPIYGTAIFEKSYNIYKMCVFHLNEIAF